MDMSFYEINCFIRKVLTLHHIDVESKKMAKIRVRNFGPIKSGYQDNDGWLDFKKNTLFIGNQGSGKSTVAKVISTLSWLEKAINRRDVNERKLSKAKFLEFFRYHKIHNYFRENTYIEYLGAKYQIVYDVSMEWPEITEMGGTYHVPKIMYIPAERNLLSTISDAFDVKGLPDNLFTFAEELRNAQKALNGKKLELPIGNYSYEYDEIEDTSFVEGDGYRINLIEASSGIQSFTPLYLVSRNLSMSIAKEEEILRKNMSVTQSIRMNDEIAEVTLNNTISDGNKKNEINKIRSRYYNTCFLNVVEEPEQNLFPSSQWEMLKNLLKINNMNEGNKLLMTTHSPYIVNYLSIAVKGFELYKQHHSNSLTPKLNDIIPSESTINPEDLVIYEFNEVDGSIRKLDDYKGLPSEENYLNAGLGELNDIFIDLLELEDQCQ